MGLIENTLMIVVTTFLFCGMLCGFIALTKDRSWLGFALVGLLLGPIGLYITGNAELGTSRAREQGEEPSRGPGADGPDVDKS